MSSSISGKRPLTKCGVPKRRHNHPDSTRCQSRVSPQSAVVPKDQGRFWPFPDMRVPVGGVEEGEPGVNVRTRVNQDCWFRFQVSDSSVQRQRTGTCSFMKLCSNSKARPTRPAITHCLLLTFPRPFGASPYTHLTQGVSITC